MYITQSVQVTADDILNSSKRCRGGLGCIVLYCVVWWLCRLISSPVIEQCLRLSSASKYTMVDSPHELLVIILENSENIPRKFPGGQG